MKKIKILKMFVIVYCFTLLHIACVDESTNYQSTVKQKIEPEKIENNIEVIATVGGSNCGQVKSFVYEKDNMKYRIFSISDGFEYGSIIIINLTKEELEIELIKKQIKELENY